MNIQPLCSRIRLETCDFERRKRMWQTGLAQAMYKPPVTNSIPRIIEMRLLEPITREFCGKPDRTSTIAGWFRIPVFIYCAKANLLLLYPFPIRPQAECSSNT